MQKNYVSLLKEQYKCQDTLERLAVIAAEAGEAGNAIWQACHFWDKALGDWQPKGAPRGIHTKEEIT